MVTPYGVAVAIDACGEWRKQLRRKSWEEARKILRRPENWGALQHAIMRLGPEWGDNQLFRTCPPDEKCDFCDKRAVSVAAILDLPPDAWDSIVRAKKRERSW